MNKTVKAQTYWVWTKEAERRNPARTRAGERIWGQRDINAPKWMLDDGLIVDSTEFIKEGQIDLLDLL